MRKIKVQFECLTPVFIGSGQQLDYMNIMPYSTNEGLESKALYEIHPENVLQDEVKNKFLELIQNRKEFLIPYEYMRFIEKYNLDKKILGDTFDKDIFHKIDENKKQGEVKNQIFIHLFSTSRMGAYIPGSSVKGMLKTPYIKNNLEYFDRRDGSAKNISDDPFNHFLARDSDHHKFKIHVGNIEVKNFPKKPVKGDSNKGKVSNIPCYCQYLAPGSLFECEIQDDLNKLYDFKQTHEFYLSAFEKLKDQVYQKDNNLDDAFEVKINAIDVSKQEFLISIGGHGGVWTKKCLGDIDQFWRLQDRKNVNHKSSFRKSIYFRMPIGWCKGTWQEV